nr:hypothetical protein [Tanacetum cinerariifolium]
MVVSVHVSLFFQLKRNLRDSVQLETAVNTISYEYLLDFTSEYGIRETLHPELPGPGDRIVDFPEGKVGVYTSKRPRKNTPQCYTKPLDSLKNYNNRFFWVDECVFPTVVDWRTNASKDEMPANGTYSVEDVRALDTHRTPIQKQPEMLLCMVEISRRYYLGDEVYPAFHYDDDRGGKGPVQFDSCSKSYEERSPLDFAHEAEASGRGTAAPEMPPPEDSRKRGYDGTDTNAPPMSLRRDHADLRPSGVPADVSDPDPLAFADASSPHLADVAYLLDTPEACQDLVDHAAPPGYFSELRHMHNEDFLGQYNINLARQVAMGSQLRIRFEQEAKLLRKSVAQVARRDQRIQARESKIKNLEALLETEAGMKRAAEEKSVGLSQELERMRAQFSELQVSNERLSQQVDALQQQVSGEETLKAAFEDYKRQQDQLVEQRCAEMDARLDALSIDFDEELYPHMLTAIAGRSRSMPNIKSNDLVAYHRRVVKQFEHHNMFLFCSLYYLALL